jgi:hypothetical protein
MNSAAVYFYRQLYEAIARLWHAQRVGTLPSKYPIVSSSDLLGLRPAFLETRWPSLTRGRYEDVGEAVSSAIHDLRNGLRTNNAKSPVKISMPMTNPKTGIQLPVAS